MRKRFVVKIEVEVDTTAYNAEYGDDETPDQIEETLTSSIIDAAWVAHKHLIPAVSIIGS